MPPFPFPSPSPLIKASRSTTRFAFRRDDVRALSPPEIAPDEPRLEFGLELGPYKKDDKYAYAVMII